MTIHFDSTIKAFQGGLAEFGVAKGIKNIDGWMEKLEGADFRGAKIIHENLGHLKNQLEADNLDGAAIGALLKALSQETKRAASHAEGAASEKITQLAELLFKSGADLSK